MNNGLRITFGVIVLAAALAAAPAAFGADTRVRSETALHVYETDTVLGTGETRTPLYEHLSVHVTDLTTRQLDLFVYGWGRVDTNADEDTTEGELSAGYLEYRDRDRGLRARLGRFYLVEGIAAEVLDGVMIKGRLPQGFAGSLFAGSPVEDTEGSGEGGDSLFGGRGSWTAGDRLEVGVTWLTETGDFSGEDREEAGADIWIMPSGQVELFGRSVYNLATEGTASYRAVVRLSLTEPVVVQVGGEGYDNEHLLQAVTTPALGLTSLDPADEVRTVFARVDWELTDNLELSGSIRNTSHSVDDPGDSSRRELGVRLAPFAGARVGVSAAAVTADQSRDEYLETRGYLMTGVGALDLSLDALSIRYEEPIDGEDSALQLVGSAGMRLGSDLKLSGDVRYTTSPTYDKDVALFIRALYTL